MTENDSNDEKSGTEVDSCVKGSRTRKAVPPPEDKILLEPLRAVMAPTRSYPLAVAQLFMGSANQ